MSKQKPEPEPEPAPPAARLYIPENENTWHHRQPGDPPPVGSEEWHRLREATAEKPEQEPAQGEGEGEGEPAQGTGGADD